MATIKGGDKLEQELKKIAEKLTSASTLRVGFLEGATYPDGTPVAMVAAVHNYGAPAAGIPARPFFSNMIAEKSGEWPDTVKAALQSNNNDVKAALAVVGEHVRGQLQQSIVDFVGVPLKPSTIERKGFDKQLINTSHMLNSADYEVE